MPFLLIASRVDYLVLISDVHVEIALHSPHVFVVIAGGRQDLEADVAEGVQNNHGAEE